MNLYSVKQIKTIFTAGQIAYDTHMYLSMLLKPGVTTQELNEKAYNFIKSKGGTPGFLGYKGYKYTICTSINDVVVHGLPSNKVKLKDGDLITIDLGVKLEGLNTDNAWTWPVGNISEDAKNLLAVTWKSFFKAFSVVKSGIKTGIIGETIEKYIKNTGFSIVKDYCGHCVGKEVHEKPIIPNFGKRKKGVIMRPGMVFALEPMINQGTYKVKKDKDGWTVRTEDGKLSAHFEHTIAILDKGPIICTAPLDFTENLMGKLIMKGVKDEIIKQ